MSAELINLRRARKAKARSEKEKQSEANRVTHGTPKALRKLGDARREKAEKALDAHRLKPDTDDG